jgi:hypothetical protein
MESGGCSKQAPCFSFEFTRHVFSVFYEDVGEETNSKEERGERERDDV